MRLSLHQVSLWHSSCVAKFVSQPNFSDMSYSQRQLIKKSHHKFHTFKTTQKKRKILKITFNWLIIARLDIRDRYSITQTLEDIIIGCNAKRSWVVEAMLTFANRNRIHCRIFIWYFYRTITCKAFWKREHVRHSFSFVIFFDIIN